MNHLKLFLTVACIACCGLLGLYTMSIWPKENITNDSEIPTESISEDLSMGGVAVKQVEGTAEDNQTDSTPNIRPQSKPATVEAIAPKQAEVQRSTPVEFPYRALRTSNDPLPQPTWLMNATKLQTAWDRSTGSGVVVAVIDSGFALNHEDLAGQWFINPLESGMTTSSGRCWTGTPVDKSSNNCDDDNNGYRDDWRGWDFVGVNNLPQAGETNPSGNGVAHGTQVAGLVGAAGNNNLGTATVAWNNRIMPLQALDDNGSGYTSSVAAAVYYAVDNGAAVINMSLGGDTNDPTLATAITYAFNRGVVVVAAAGNCGTGTEQGCDPALPGAMSYPALNPYVIAVGASASNNYRASFSSYGPALDVVAPGSGNMVSPMWHSTNGISAYASSLYGTSFASPIVASYVGLIKSLRPSSSVDDITALVSATTFKPTGMLYSSELGHGIIDADAGLRVAAGLNLTSATPELLQTGGVLSEHSFQSNSTLASGCKSIAGSYCTVWAKNASGYDRYLPYIQTDGGGQAGWSWSADWLGSGDWSLRARHGSGVSITPYWLSQK